MSKNVIILALLTTNIWQAMQESNLLDIPLWQLLICIGLIGWNTCQIRLYERGRK